MCEFINEGGIKCGCKNKYGTYCNKHKREYLVVNDFIIVNKFTNKHSDYLKKYLNENKLRYKDQSSLTKLFKTINSLL